MLNVPWRAEAASALRMDRTLTIMTVLVIGMNTVVAIHYHQTDRPVMATVFVAAIVMLVMVRAKLLNARIQTQRASLLLGYIQDKNLIMSCAECRVHAVSYLSGGLGSSAYRAWASHIEDAHERHANFGA